MLDIKLIRENPKVVMDDLKKRKDPEKIKMLNDLIANDKKYRELLQQVEDLKHKRNSLSKEISKLKKEKKDASSKMQEAKDIPDKLNISEDEMEELKEKIDYAMMRIPNILHESVPVGEGEDNNVILKAWGKKPQFDFEPKNHADIVTNLGLLDEERAAKIAGSGFYYLKGSLALLDQAIIRYAVESLVKKGYVFVIPPHMMRRDAYEGMVDLADFESVMYKIENDDLYMIATAEHPVGSMFKGEVLNKDDLPLKFVGLSTNFRREIGAHGKYTRGLFRVHQFNKVEQFIFCQPKNSWKYHEELQKNSEELYQGLGLHYQVVNVCTGDIGSIAAKKYDILSWMADGVFRETGSNSNCTDYQARRLNIKYREKEGQAPAGYVHTLNNTALATSRIMVSIIEQYQQKDGTVLIPKVLLPYMCGIKKLEKLK
ncbi:MAG: serine--tRNA ligase [Candidatus Aenigmatarchaeota archaeon]